MASSQETPNSRLEPLPEALPSPILTLTPNASTTLHIRPFHPSDTPQVARVANNPLIASCMRNTFPYPYTLQDAQNWIKIATTSFTDPPTKPNISGRPLHLDYAVVLNSQVIGAIGLKPFWDIESDAFEVGYWLGEEAWGKGIMTLVLKEFINWTWEQFPTIRRLEAMTYSFNEGSKRVLTNAGFVKEGVKREAVRKGDKVWDMVIFGLLRREWTTQAFSIVSAEP
ncbi:acyl-CoA N-acyltransferase [Triangularia verruculosa]|uniref:Acyl-CoA N-acyltransferase n=1 Tax=Triangularia verruculosa TaxID=2587418 RepID=A0AAN6XKE1_9PEZI|nr:acyl-CoA N-acyltransferase [Triangularia verruculosa]